MSEAKREVFDDPWLVEYIGGQTLLTWWPRIETDAYVLSMCSTGRVQSVDYAGILEDRNKKLDAYNKSILDINP